MTNLVTSSGNLSTAWGEALLRMCDRGVTELSPLTVTVTDFDGDGFPVERGGIRSAIDDLLGELRKAKCDTVAGTIFPQSLWNQRRPSNVLFERFGNIWPKLRKCKGNVLGTYFRRLTSFTPKGATEPVNQLAEIIESHQTEPRTQFALSVYDPTRDALKRRGFPCLDYVTFAAAPRQGTLSMMAIYPRQYHIDRAYGNYLGLCRLGRFMAVILRLRLVSMTCISQRSLRGEISKSRLSTTCDRVRRELYGGTEE
jgi:hypothetical protein